jgi:hypothetical protein
MAQPYPDEQTWWTPVFAKQLEADYMEAGQPFGPMTPEQWIEMMRWFARTSYDISYFNMTKEQSMAKHRAEWRGELGLVDPVPPYVPLPRLVRRGKFLGQEDGTHHTIVMNSDFNLLGRMVAGEDVTSIIKQRVGCGFTWGRVFTAYNIAGIGCLVPSPALYECVPRLLELAARFDYRLELVGFTGPYTREHALTVEVEQFDPHAPDLFTTEQAFVNHWEQLIAATDGWMNALLERINEANHKANQGAPLSRLRRPAGTLASAGSNCADQPGVTPYWDISGYHTNGLNEWQRKVGHNAMELADRDDVPYESNENTRFDNDQNPRHARDAARAAALLCAGSCCHTPRGKTSELWDGPELEWATEWAAGAHEVPLEFQDGQYDHLEELEEPGIIRAYSRTLSDGREYIVTIAA